MTRRLELVLNGRFLFRPVTGVERLALELTRGIAQVIRECGEVAPTLRVATPREPDAGLVGRLGLPDVPVTRVGRRGGQLWEQTDLARHAPGAWLLDLCNLGPLARRRQALVVCDAQVYRQPRSYSLRFRAWYRLMTPLLARRAAALFTISHHSQAELEAVGAFPAGKSHVLRLGVDHIHRVVPDPTVIERHGLTQHRFVLAIGSLAPHKNLRLLVDAFLAARLPDDVRLVIAGGGNGRIFADAGLPLDPRISYLGRVGDTELRALYGSALAFACPARTEGFGLTPLEAMACGSAVIATTGGAVPEVCGDAALYAAPDAPDEWTVAIERLVRDADLRAALAARARVHAATFTWRRTALDFLEVLAAHDGDAALAARLRDLREQATAPPSSSTRKDQS